MSSGAWKWYTLRLERAVGDILREEANWKVTIMAQHGILVARWLRAKSLISSSCLKQLGHNIQVTQFCLKADRQVESDCLRKESDSKLPEAGNCREVYASRVDGDR